MKITIGPNGSIYWENRFTNPPRGGSYSPARPLREDAPQEIKDLAAKHWTPEVIQAAKDRIAAAGTKAKGQ
jgi:hypothetical protein